MGIDLAHLGPGEPAVVATPFRLRREQGYGYVRALWWSWFTDGRLAVSVPPGADNAVRRIVSGIRGREGLFAPALAQELKVPVNVALQEAGLQGIDRVIHDVHFACNPQRLRRHNCGQCRRLTDESIPPAKGLTLPTHCFPDGIAHAVIADGKAASIAFAHRTGVMEERIVDLAITTASAYRGRGYAKTAVSAVVEHVARDGGEAIYGCRPDNHASIATARGVGFVPYARTLILSAAAPDLP